MRSMTPKQCDFLLSYAADLPVPALSALAGGNKAAFVAVMLGLDFDDGDASSSGRVRTAKSLGAKGCFASLDVHPDISGAAHIYVEFSRFGAELLYALLSKYGISRDV